jgi:uncharacterized protein (DUF1501 family)
MELRRRSFIKYASLAAAGNLAGLKQFGALNALAQTTPDYRALVCVFLFGGNDGNNILIPFDTAGYQNYSAVRGDLALPQSTLLQLSTLPNFAVTPDIAEVQSMFNAGNAAFVANVGNLTIPLTQAEYLAGASTPNNLFSHTDQQTEWQNASASGATATGWAGRISDSLGPTYNPSATIPMITSIDGDTLFCNGAATTPVSVSAGNLSTGACGEGSFCTTRQQSAQSIVQLSSGVSLVQADNTITSNAYTYSAILSAATAGLSPLKTVFPVNPIGAQLQQVAQIIQARAALGVSRQIFFCGFGNFDTHSNQLALQSALLQELSPALLAFYQATNELNLGNQITTFTMSDFARTLQPNTNTGSDHAWGSHHIVFGGAVKGGKMYGTFPTLALGGPDDAGSNGRWIPSTSSVQYAATLAQWFGVPAAQLVNIFPNIGAFSTPTLGFV